MKFLIIEQDLRVSGTSQGIISRSFLSKLRMAKPHSIIDVVYLKQYASDDQLELLPVNSIQEHILDLKIPFTVKWFNKIYWRLFHVSLKEQYIHKTYGSYIAKIDFEQYDHIFIRSAGLEHETILGSKDLPILKRAVLTFHEPYPVFWCAGTQNSLSNLELFRLKKMQEVVSQAKCCMANALLSEDLSYLYGSKKKFYVLPHQYSKDIFDFTDTSQVFNKEKKITISYHGAIQFGRDVMILLDAYRALLETNSKFKDETEFILRVKGINIKFLKERYAAIPNIIILDTVNFSNSAFEQIHLTDINVILENGPLYCNILVGKAPFLASFNKPVFSLSPERSEMRRIIKDEQFIAQCNDKEEIKEKLENLIINRMVTDEPVYPFGDYFTDENFTKLLDKVLNVQ